jgi:hypothetical protein
MINTMKYNPDARLDTSAIIDARTRIPMPAFHDTFATILLHTSIIFMLMLMTFIIIDTMHNEGK